MSFCQVCRRRKGARIISITDSLLDLAEHQARMVLLQLKEDLVPSWVMFSRRTHRAEIIATPWRNDLEKRLCERRLRELMRKKQIAAYSFLSEAWVATAPADWSLDKPLPEAERPAQRADRKEVVMAFASDGTTKEWRVWEIKRDWHEQIITLEPRPLPEAIPAGWVTELL
jgi:hypothetical protein